MSESQTFVLAHPRARQGAVAAVLGAPEGHQVIVREPTRNAQQNAALHAMLSDIVAAKVQWDGEEHDIEFWKGLAVSGWAIATKARGQVTRGWENEICLIRRSTTRMTVSEMSSLLDYLGAWMSNHEPPIPIRDNR